MPKKVLKTTFAAAILSCAISAYASPIVFTGSSGSLAASVSFDVSGDDLIVTLTNIATSDPRAPGDILTGVIFSLPENPSLTKVSATLASGSTVIHGPSPSTGAGGVVGGEWAYSNALSGAFSGQQSIYSAGYFGGNNVFPGSNLQGPASVGGVQYGITTLYDTAGNDNGGIKSEGLIKNSVEFVLSGLSSDFLLTSITGVSFQYGTSLSETNFVGTCISGCTPPPTTTAEIPEPSPLALATLGLTGLIGSVRRKKVAASKTVS